MLALWMVAAMRRCKAADAGMLLELWEVGLVSPHAEQTGAAAGGRRLRCRRRYYWGAGAALAPPPMTEE